MIATTVIQEPKVPIWKHIALSLFIGTAVLLPLIWMIMDRDPPYTFNNVEINPQTVTAGEDIVITFHVTHGRRSCGPGLVYREFTDSSGKLTVYDPIPRAFPPKREEGQFTRVAKTSSALEPGVAVYRGMACYPCNPLQSILRWNVCVETPPVKFNVLRSFELQGIQGEK